MPIDREYITRESFDENDGSMISSETRTKEGWYWKRVKKVASLATAFVAGVVTTLGGLLFTGGDTDNAAPRQEAPVHGEQEPGPKPAPELNDKGFPKVTKYPKLEAGTAPPGPDIRPIPDDRIGVDELQPPGKALKKVKPK